MFLASFMSKSANHLRVVNVVPETGSGSVTIEPSDYEKEALEKKMYLSLDWVDKVTRKEGRSYTTPFTASEQAPTPSGADPLSKLATELGYIDEELPYSNEGLINSTSSDPASTATATAVQSSPTSSLTSATPNNSDANSSSGAGSNRLPPGAIAGIVVGAVIGGLLIIGALASFLCFRRRSGGKQQRRHIHGDVGYASDSGAAAMMMREKEMPGVNHSSPHSAYADDGGRLHNRDGVGEDNDSTIYSNTPPYQEERGVMTAGIGTQQHQSRDSLRQNEYSLYNGSNGNGDRGVTSSRPQSYAADSAIRVAVSGGAPPNTTERERNGSVGGGAAAVGRTSHQTDRPGSEVRSPSRYAHLIEEGMTEDEIRRLEDEERQLDAAIEDAGRHDRPK
ncbi:hypothetical protein PG994_006772 [Apiospora phragmitis]|uniref:Mid2 domain-containing protein n=1 Tax=Apiospora phragmitis TaxID=2905665 RepID=A0ABR1VG01_9PEZI